MKSRPECRSIQISFLIPFKCCGLGFVLELCHNALFYDTANLIWQLTAPRQSDLPFSLPFIPVLAMCTRLLSCPGSGTSLAPWRGGPVESTDRKLLLLFFFGILLPTRLSHWIVRWVPVPIRCKQRGGLVDARGCPHPATHPGIPPLCPHPPVKQYSMSRHHSWPPGSCFKLFPICTVILKDKGTHKKKCWRRTVMSCQQQRSPNLDLKLRQGIIRLLYRV